MRCSEWVPSEWESMDALQWMGAVRMRVIGCASVNVCVRMRVNGCAAVNGCRQNESQWMLCSEWVPSEWEVNGCSAVNGVPSEWESMDCLCMNGCRQNESQWMPLQWMVPSEWESMDALQWMGPSEWESMDALQWMGAVRMKSMDALQWMGAVRWESMDACIEWCPSDSTLLSPWCWDTFLQTWWRKSAFLWMVLHGLFSHGAVQWRLVNQRVDCSSHPPDQRRPTAEEALRKNCWSHSPPDTNSRATRVWIIRAQLNTRMHCAINLPVDLSCWTQMLGCSSGLFCSGAACLLMVMVHHHHHHLHSGGSDGAHSCLITVTAAEQRRRMNYNCNNHTWLITDAGGGYDSSTRPDGMLTVVAWRRRVNAKPKLRFENTQKYILTELSCFQLIYKCY